MVVVKSPISQSLENCDPNLGVIVQRVSSFKNAAGLISMSQELLQFPPCCQRIDDQEGSEAGTGLKFGGCDDRSSSGPAAGRRICGTKVQSLVQAFESMISLAEVGTSHFRKTGDEHKWRQPPKMCRIDEEMDFSSYDDNDDAGGDNSDSGPNNESRKHPDENDDEDSSVSENENTASQVRSFSDEEFSTCGSYDFYPDSRKGSRATCLQPFSLRTQARGAKKEYEFRRKLEKMWEEDTKSRIPVAQGLPWTTDEAEVVPKPPPKETTVPMDVRLCTQYRSVRRAQFDQYIAAKIMYIEQERQERQRLQELAEQDEIKRLRKEMIPRAQLMPYFDRPFMPQRSSKPLTVPKEPTFHCSHDHKRAKCCLA